MTSIPYLENCSTVRLEPFPRTGTLAQGLPSLHPSKSSGYSGQPDVTRETPPAVTYGRHVSELKSAMYTVVDEAAVGRTHRSRVPALRHIGGCGAPCMCRKSTPRFVPYLMTPCRL